MDQAEARAAVELIRDDLASLAQHIQDAYEARVWIALGYSSWAELCRSEFGGGIKLPTAKRKEITAELWTAGMPNTAISTALGVGVSTTLRDHDDQNGHRPATVLRTDGKRAPAQRPARTPAPRSGGTRWSKRVQSVSADVPMGELSNDEIQELRGAATFLRDYCVGELTIRKAQS